MKHVPPLSLLVERELPLSEFYGVFAKSEVKTKSTTNYAFGSTRITHFLVYHDEWGMPRQCVSVLVATDGLTQRIDLAHFDVVDPVLAPDDGSTEAAVFCAGMYVELRTRALRQGLKVDEVGRSLTTPEAPPPDLGVQP